MEKRKIKIKSKIDFYTDIVSTNANDRPLIYISNEAIELKHNNDKLKEENDLLKNTIEKATKCINRYAIENEDYSKIYNDEEKELLNILRSEDNENTDYSKKRINKLKEIYNDYVREEDKELIRLTKEVDRLNNIINKALRKLRATKDHYKIKDINNAIIYTIRILERSDKE